MKETRVLMGMPTIVEIVDAHAMHDDIENVFRYFTEVDARFSTYKDTSEVCAINRGELSRDKYSSEMQEVLRLAEKTRRETDGYFDITRPDGTLDPSGLVKGWSINTAAARLRAAGFRNFWVEIGGDIQTSGLNVDGEEWSIGIRNPFNEREIVKIVYPRGRGIATSGTYIRGQHIYDPHSGKAPSPEIVSLTVIGLNVYEADRFATAAFAMGKNGISFIEKISGLEGYQIDKGGTATMTSGFGHFTDTTLGTI